MQGRPFVLLGVNSDPDREEARRINASGQVNWRSWWDGRVHGPVALAWQMPGLPYVILIDHKGVIRNRALAGVELERAIDQLVGDIPPAGPLPETISPARKPPTKRTP